MFLIFPKFKKIIQKFLIILLRLKHANFKNQNTVLKTLILLF